MTKKPKPDLSWATEGSRKVKPGDTDKARGWSADKTPTIGWLNWWMNLAYQWQDYLSESVTKLFAAQKKQEGAIVHASALAQNAQNTHEVNQKSLSSLKTTQDMNAQIIEKKEKERDEQLYRITLLTEYCLKRIEGSFRSTDEIRMHGFVDKLKEYLTTKGMKTDWPDSPPINPLKTKN